MNFRALSPLLFFFFLLSCQDEEGKAAFEDRKITFNSEWQFHLNDSVQDKDAISENANWRTLDVPHDWSIEGEFSPEHPAGTGGGALPGGLGWYKKSFTVEESDSTKVISVMFDGVYHNSEVWINGKYL